jgi:hypothetical protein
MFWDSCSAKARRASPMLRESGSVTRADGKRMSGWGREITGSVALDIVSSVLGVEVGNSYVTVDKSDFTWFVGKSLFMSNLIFYYEQ